MSPSSNTTASEHNRWVPAVTLLILVIALGFSTTMGSAFGPSPLVWFGLATYLALRERTQRWVPALYVPAAIIFLVWFSKAAMGICLPFVVGLLLAYLLDPIIDRLEARLGRSWAILVVATPVAGLVAALVFLVLPSMMSELAHLVERIPELRGPLQTAYESVVLRMNTLGFEVERGDVTDLIISRLEQLGGALGDAGLGVVRGVQGVLDLVTFMVITPVVTFYMLRDFDVSRGHLLSHVPKHRRQEILGFSRRLDRSVSGYLRGQLVVGLMIGACFYLGLTLLGMQYALVVGVSSVVLNLIPYVGSVMTAILALAVALLSDPTWASVAKVAGLYAFVQLLDAAVVSPRVMGQSLELHPVAVMLALLLAGQFLGLAGIIIAVPAAALLKETISRWAPEVISLLPGVDTHSHLDATE